MRNMPPLVKRFAKGWVMSNFGIVQGFHRTRSEAIKACEDSTRQPWRLCKSYMEVRKVILVETR